MLPRMPKMDKILEPLRRKRALNPFGPSKEFMLSSSDDAEPPVTFRR